MTATAAPPINLVWKKALIFMGVMALGLAAVITKDDPLPKWFLILCALSGGIYFLRSGLLRLEILLCLLVAYLPFSIEVPMDLAIPGFNFTNFLIAVSLLLWLKMPKDELGPTDRIPLKTPFKIFLILGFFSILRGVGFGMDYLGEASIEFYRKWVVPIFLFFLYSRAVRDKETLKNIVIVLVAVVTLVGLMAIYEYLDTDERVGGVFNQPNQLAAFFNYYMFIPFAFFFLNMKRVRNWAWLIPFLICLRGVMVTFSRAGYMAFVVSIFAITFFRSKKLILILGILALMVYKNPALLPHGVRYRLDQTVEHTPTYSKAVRIGGNALDQSSSDRVKVWAGALFMIHEHPFLGVGYHLFEKKILHYYTGRKAHDPHNTYLYIAAELGIPALLIFLWILWKVFLEARRVYRESKDPFLKALGLGFLAGFFAILISNMFGSRLNYTEISSYFWILAALIFRARKLEAVKPE